MKYIDYPTKTKKNSFSLWIQGPSALLVKKEKWCIQGPATICDHRKPEKSLITNLLSPNFRNRLTSELQRAPHSRTDCDFEKLIPPRSETNDQRHQRGRRNLYGIIRKWRTWQRGEFIQQSAAPLRVAITKTLPNQPVVIGDATQPMIAIPLDKEVLEEDTLSSDIFATFEALFTKRKHWPT